MECERARCGQQMLNKVTSLPSTFHCYFYFLQTIITRMKPKSKHTPGLVSLGFIPSDTYLMGYIRDITSQIHAKNYTTCLFRWDDKEWCTVGGSLIPSWECWHIIHHTRHIVSLPLVEVQYQKGLPTKPHRICLLCVSNQTHNNLLKKSLNEKLHIWNDCQSFQKKKQIRLVKGSLAETLITSEIQMNRAPHQCCTGAHDCGRLWKGKQEQLFIFLNILFRWFNLTKYTTNSLRRLLMSGVYKSSGLFILSSGCRCCVQQETYMY